MRKLIVLLISSLSSFTCAFAQSPVIIQKDGQIEKMVSEVSADSLHANIIKLVSFGTRSTLSVTNNPNRGIGAARNWILSRFNAYAKSAGGRLTARLDTNNYQPDGKRIDV